MLIIVSMLIHIIMVVVVTDRIAAVGMVGIAAVGIAGHM